MLVKIENKEINVNTVFNQVKDYLENTINCKIELAEHNIQVKASYPEEYLIINSKKIISTPVIHKNLRIEIIVFANGWVKVSYQYQGNGVTICSAYYDNANNTLTNFELDRSFC